MTEATNDLAQLASQFKHAHEEVVGLGVELKTKFENGEKVGVETKESVDKALVEMNGLKARLDEVEQRASRSAEAETKSRTFADDVIEHKGLQEFASNGGHGSVKMELKAITSVSVNGLQNRHVESDPVNMLRERLTVRDLLNVIKTNSPVIEYAKQTVRTNAAAPVAEEGAKPYSNYVWAPASANAKVIAHLAKLTRQALDDVPRLAAEIESEMRYGLDVVEEAQILNGNGSGANLQGIIPQATAYAAPVGVLTGTATRVDMIRLAMVQNAIALLPADGIVLNLLDWAAIELQKTTDGGYLFANPQGRVSATLWGLPVAETQAIAQDKFLVGAFKASATLYDRMATEVLLSSENVDDFEKNLLTMRAEKRVALAVKRPQGFTYGDFGAIA